MQLYSGSSSLRSRNVSCARRERKSYAPHIKLRRIGKQIVIWQQEYLSSNERRNWASKSIDTVSRLRDWLFQRPTFVGDIVERRKTRHWSAPDRAIHLSRYTHEYPFNFYARRRPSSRAIPFYMTFLRRQGEWNQSMVATAMSYLVSFRCFWR